MRRLGKRPQAKHGRLRNLEGQLVDSSSRADTLAEYLEKIQWSVQFANVCPAESDMFETDLNLETGQFNIQD